MNKLLRRDFMMGALAAYIGQSCARAFQLGAVISATSPGGRAAGETNDTKALQRAIDAVHERGGGTVHIPPGRYVTGSLVLRSNVSLWLDNGATLVMSSDPKDFLPLETLSYDPKADRATASFQMALLTGDTVESVTIFGEGIIDCDRKRSGGPKPIALRRCSHVNISGITIRNAPSYNISLLGCDFVTIHGVTIQNGFSDGIDPDSSRNVRISNCFVESVDDAICLKASGALGERRATENVTIDNCVLRTASIHFKCGTESCGDFRNIAVSNCVFQGGMGMRHGNPGIALYTVDGGALDNVVLSNIAMRDVGTPLAILRGDRDRCGFGQGPGLLKSVRIANVIATGAKLCSVIAGIPGSPVSGIEIAGFSVTMINPGASNVALENVPEKPKQYPDPTMFGPLPASCLFLRHAEDVALRDLQLHIASGEARPAIVADDVSGLELLGGRDWATSATGPHLWFKNVRSSIVETVSTTPVADHAYRISGPKTSNLVFKTGTPHNFDRTLLLDGDVPRHAVHVN